MQNIVLVAAGGAIGSTARHLVNVMALRLFGSGFPAGTLIVNAAGGVAMGLLVGWLARRSGDTHLHASSLRLFLATGVLGGFTTFSAFSLDVVTLWQRGEAATAALYVVLSVLLAVGGVVAGMALVRGFA